MGETTPSTSPKTPPPRKQSSRLDPSSEPNAGRHAPDPLTLKPASTNPPSPDSPASQASRGPAMAAPAAAAQGKVSGSLPRNSSIETAISAVTSAAADKSNAQHDSHKPMDIAGLIKAAGSPEAVIQHLLKDKQSQHQQNTQLWRLVDKQRAMILGLNKDLEQTLKEKEKYKRKLKDLMANPAVLKAAGAPHGEAKVEGRRGPALPPVDVATSKASGGAAPDSPSMESESQKNSPVDVSMVPCPITPPADRPQELQSAVDERLDPIHELPDHQEGPDNSDHEAQEETADAEHEVESHKQPGESAYDVALPTSRSLGSGSPPVETQPKQPTSAPSIVTSFVPTSQSEDGLAKFPAPPRKSPPAPLRLKQSAHHEAAPEDSQSEPDHDQLSPPAANADEKRGRRRTRQEDDDEREVTAIQDAEERSASKPSSAVVSASPGEQNDSPGSGSGSLRSVRASLRDQGKKELGIPLRSPGLPMSPRPVGTLPPSSPGIGMRAVSAPLSPRPPRQPIPLPSSGSPFAARSTPSSPVELSKATKQATEPSSGREDTPEQIEVYKGFVTEDYPDLLLAPNALPLIKVKVASSRMKPSRASLLALTQLDEDPVFTLAILSASHGGELWRVEKDIISFAKLDQRLKQCVAFTAKTPERSLFSGHAPAKLDARRVALEQYMTELLDTPLDEASAEELCKYLSSNTLPPNADETGTAARPPEPVGGQTSGKEARPVRSGYLTKKGKNFGGWKARFFVVDGPKLKYYETPGGTHLGTIKLTNAQIGRQSQSSETQPSAPGANGEELDNQYRHAFLVLEPKKKDSSSHVKHVLCAESDQERDLWVDVLLKWIDQGDGDEADAPGSKAAVQDRHASVADLPAGQSSRKAMAQSRASHQPARSDPLIGVRYDLTQARDVPQGLPHGLKKAPEFSGMVGEPMNQQAGKLISGPRDPQVISDSSAWGNRQGAPVTTEDKKQRKRSFFGFGPRTRTSSDGQDSLFGGSETGSASTPPHGSQPQHQVFGAPLVEAVRFCSPTDVKVPLPCVVYRCVEYLEKKDAIREEGIFRLSGSSVVIKQLRERFNTEGDVNLLTDEQFYDIHAIASLLKLYFRELPTTILTRELQGEFLGATEIPDRRGKVAALSELATKLPHINATLLKYLTSFLIKIIHASDVNKMTVRNVGIVFSPTLNIPAPVFALFLQHYEDIFGMDPEQYEPPFGTPAFGTPEPDGRRGRGNARPRSEMVTRTSTSSGSASPHRRMPMEPRKEMARSTPTPPLAPMARSSPTPPSSTPRQHEASHFAQQRASTAPVSLRPAYESVYGMPSAMDVQQYKQAQRALPGYDRPMYDAARDGAGNGGQASDPASAGGRRRESSVYMGAAAADAGAGGRRRESSVYVGTAAGLQHAGSRSRLREEARF